MQLALMMGGLRPHTTEPLAPERANEILGHWHHVHEASGQPFAQAPNTAMHEPGFIYDTEPASRATVTVRTLWPSMVWHYFKAVQHAFYVEARNVTRPQVLAEVAEGLGLPKLEFAKAFASSEMREATARDFAQAQAWGIRGFPALVGEHGEDLHLIAQGYCAIDALYPRIAALQALPETTGTA
jgi:putative protein-disulfide isomerase